MIFNVLFSIYLLWSLSPWLQSPWFQLHLEPSHWLHLTGYNMMCILLNRMNKKSVAPWFQLPGIFYEHSHEIIGMGVENGKMIWKYYQSISHPSNFCLLHRKYWTEHTEQIIRCLFFLSFSCESFFPFLFLLIEFWEINPLANVPRKRGEKDLKHQ